MMPLPQPTNLDRLPRGKVQEFLDDLAALEKELAPGRVVVAHAGVQDEVVGATGDRERIELNRAETAKDLEHGLGSFLERTRRTECVARDEKAARCLGTDPHAK